MVITDFAGSLQCENVIISWHWRDLTVSWHCGEHFTLALLYGRVQVVAMTGRAHLQINRDRLYDTRYRKTLIIVVASQLRERGAEMAFSIIQLVMLRNLFADGSCGWWCTVFFLVDASVWWLKWNWSWRKSSLVQTVTVYCVSIIYPRVGHKRGTDLS